MSNGVSSRNYAFDLLKVLSIMIVMLVHSGIFLDHLHNGHVSVELFFMISGYFMAATFERHGDTSTFQYLKQRLIKLYPMYIVQFAALYWIVYFRGVITYEKSWYWIFELLLLQNVGIPHVTGLNYSMWFLSILMYSSIGIWFCMRIIPKKLFNILATVVVAVVYAYFAIVGSIEWWEYELKIFYMPVWRGIAGLLIGILVYRLSLIIIPKMTKNTTILFQAIELISIAIIIPIINYEKDNLDIVISLLAAALMLAVTSKESILGKLGNNKVVAFLCKYEYPAYLVHVIGIMIARNIFKLVKLPEFVKALILFTIVIVGAFILYNSVNFVLNGCRKNK